MKFRTMRTAALIFGMLVGALAIYLGGADDSPGLQGIGLLLIITMIYLLYSLYG